MDFGSMFQWTFGGTFQWMFIVHVTYPKQLHVPKNMIVMYVYVYIYIYIYIYICIIVDTSEITADFSVMFRRMLAGISRRISGLQNRGFPFRIMDSPSD